MDIFLKNYTNGQQVHKKVFNITNIRERQIKTAKRYTSHVRITVIKKTRGNKC